MGPHELEMQDWKQNKVHAINSRVLKNSLTKRTNIIFENDYVIKQDLKPLTMCITVQI